MSFKKNCFMLIFQWVIKINLLIGFKKLSDLVEMVVFFIISFIKMIIAIPIILTFYNNCV